MKDRLFLAAVLVLLGAALFTAQRRHIDAPASARSILYLVADSERELTRLPAKFTRISDADEISAGNRIAESYLSDRKMSADDMVVEAYVRQIGGQIAPYAQRKLPYQFHYIPDRSFINAFALPGGHVFIGAGLIEQMDSDDELASVLGHEIEHVDHYHCVERLQVEAALRKVPLAGLFGVPIEIFQAGYSKDQELEADREGVRLASRGGYSAYGAVRMFETFDRLFQSVNQRAKSPQAELSHVAADVLEGYFRTHPLPAERISQIKAMIAREPALAARAEQDLKITYIFLAFQSLDAVEQGRFNPAVELASRSLRMKPDHVPALQALAEARFGLEDLPAAKDAYRALLARDTAAAGVVEAWVEVRVQGLLEQKKYDRGIAVVQSLLELQPGQPKLLRLLALTQASKSDIAGSTATAATLRRLYPDVAVQLASETEQRAAGLLSAHDFTGAVAISKLSLALRPGSSLRTLGDAEFALAHFGEAASAYQQMFQGDFDDLTLLRSFADALGSARPATAAHELEAAVSRLHSMKLPPAAVKAEVAGLGLMAGKDDPAHGLQQEVERGAIAPEALGRLGWWYFRAHRLAEADAVLQKALSLRPDDAEIQNNLAWVRLEQGKDAFGLVGGGLEPYPGVENKPAIGVVIAQWQQKKSNEALKDWPNISREEPQWLNSEWRKAIYPQHIADAVGQMEAEQQRRELARRAALRHE